jgi:succinate-semialdehyde dehydrogenase/glutarate-semialdehyde dehydrogenase
VQRKIYDRFVAEFARISSTLKVGNGLTTDSQMGPLANPRRVTAMEEMLIDARERGAEIVAGGRRIGREGNFFEPTVVAGISGEARLMRDEPFGPIALVLPFDDDDAVITEANALPFGLASYVFTTNTRRADRAARGLMHGMVSINHFGLQACEAPFGGVKDSGMGHEGGIEGLQAFMFAKTVSQLS